MTKAPSEHFNSIPRPQTPSAEEIHLDQQTDTPRSTIRAQHATVVVFLNCKCVCLYTCRQRESYLTGPQVRVVYDICVRPIMKLEHGHEGIEVLSDAFINAQEFGLLIVMLPKNGA